MKQGYIKFYREWLDNPIISRDSDYLAVWLYLVSNATFTETEGIFKGEKILLKRGQVLTSRGIISKSLKIGDSKVKRILQRFKYYNLIDQRTDMQQSLISIKDWGFFQGEIDQRMTNERPTSQETEKEKEKSSKREKEKEKEIYKNEKNVISVCMGDTQNEILSLGRYENVFVDRSWLDSFKARFWYYDKVIDKLSVFKEAKGISNIKDEPYLEQFAIEDKDRYIRRESTFDADDFFEATLARSYADLDDD